MIKLPSLSAYLAYSSSNYLWKDRTKPQKYVAEKSIHHPAASSHRKRYRNWPDQGPPGLHETILSYRLTSISVIFPADQPPWAWGPLDEVIGWGRGET